MRVLFLLLLALLSAPNAAAAQIGIINDADGWTNLRVAPKGNADVLWRIPDNITFWYDDDAYEAGARWIEVIIPSDTLTHAPQTSYVDEELLLGYVHRSRIRDLDDLKPYTGQAFSFKYVLEDFNPAGRELDYLGETVLLYIDQRHPWGTDGNLPRVAVKSIEATYNGRELKVPTYWFADLFECTNKLTITQAGDNFFVHQWNSDGAGGYQVTWVFSDNGVERRIIMAP